MENIEQQIFIIKILVILLVIALLGYITNFWLWLMEIIELIKKKGYH